MGAPIVFMLNFFAYVFAPDFSGPNRAMPPRCAMRFESHTLKSLASEKVFLKRKPLQVAL